jgi:hypothetical protein
VNRRDDDPTQISDVKDLACRSASDPHADSQPNPLKALMEQVQYHAFRCVRADGVVVERS